MLAMQALRLINVMILLEGRKTEVTLTERRLQR